MTKESRQRPWDDEIILPKVPFFALRYAMSFLHKIVVVLGLDRAKKIHTIIKRNIFLETDTFYAWTPVFVGVGIAFYFSLSHEPPRVGLGAELLLMTGIRLVFWKSIWARVIFLCILGFSAAQLRTHVCATPMLERDTDAAITGSLVHRENAANGRIRLLVQTETAVRSFRHPTQPSALSLGLIRLSVHPRHCDPSLMPGQRLRGRVKLHPFSGPLVPNGHDFRRQAYFQTLSASGYALGPLQTLTEKAATRSWGEHILQKIAFLRQKLTSYWLSALPGQSGAVAAALVTGERSAIHESTAEDYNRSGLAHILSISGLHFSLVAGMVFFVLRRLLTLNRRLALLTPIKKCAAFLTLMVSLLYMMISGSTVPVVRSCAMIGCAMVAILLDRNPFSMRLVATAALAILLLWPESLTSASFQLSFAAVIGLVAYFERPRMSAPPNQRRSFIPVPLRSVGGYLSGIIVTTCIASLMTAPLTAILFQRFPVYSLLANMLAIPLTGFVIMPGLMLSLILAPFGAEGWINPVLSASLDALNHIAQTVGSWPAAVIIVPGGPAICHSLFVLGGLWITLWRQSWRWFGLIPCAFATVWLVIAPRPETFFIEPYKGLLAVCHQQTLWLTHSDVLDHAPQISIQAHPITLWSRYCGQHTRWAGNEHPPTVRLKAHPKERFSQRFSITKHLDHEATVQTTLTVSSKTPSLMGALQPNGYLTWPPPQQRPWSIRNTP